MIPLSADLVARAVIVAAEVYGDSPELARSTTQRKYRRSLKAAAMGLKEAVGGDLSRYCAILGLQAKNVYHARASAKPDDLLWKAASAVEKAVAEIRGPDAPKDPPSPWRPEVPRKIEIISQALERALPTIFLEHPEGATVQQVADLASLSMDDVGRAAAKLCVDHKCRWGRAATSGRYKVLTRWTETPVVTPNRGAISSLIAPQVIRHARPAEHRAPLSERILAYLAEAESTSASLAILCDAKELQVIDTLKQLVAEGRVEPGPINPNFGARHRPWRVPKEQRPCT